MGIFRQFPYTNFHEMNLDWLINKMKYLSSEWDKFVVNWEEEVKEEVDSWLVSHPEYTTTVMDGSLTENKFTNALKLKTIKEYVTPEMFGAVGDGITDDTIAVQSAIDSLVNGGCVLFSAKTYVVDSIKITTNNITLRGFKSSNKNSGSILIASSTNTGPMLDISVTSGMTIGGGIYDIALMANNERQTYTTAIPKIGINIKNRTEFILQNVYISGFKNGALYAKDWWDSDIIGLEIRACGIADTSAGLYLGSDNDSCNSLHFFGLHIEECPFQMHVDGLCSNIQFVASKFEGGAQIGEIFAGTHYIHIYEGVYGLVFNSCFFSGNTENIWVDVRNNLTAFIGCQFAKGRGTIIKNYSSGANYGKGVIIDGCTFDDFGRYTANPLWLNSRAVLSNNYFNCEHFANSIHIEGMNNTITGNQFVATATTTPLFNMGNGRNTFTGNKYDGCTKLWTGNNNNYFDNYISFFNPVTIIDVDFQTTRYLDIFWNGGTDITLTSSNIKNPAINSEIKVWSNGGTITFDNTLINGGYSLTPGKAVVLKWMNPLNKFVVMTD